MKAWHREALSGGARWAISVLVGVGLLLILVDHENANQDRAQAHANQQFAKSLLVTDRKFQQALRITTQQFSYAHNAQVCAFRAFTLPSLKSYRDAAKDPSLSPSARARNDKRIRDAELFLERLVTVPATFDCSSLPKNPPKADHS